MVSRALTFTFILAIGFVGGREVYADAEYVSKSRHLRLGATLGADRLEILSWPASGQFLRLRRVEQGAPFDGNRAHFGYDVLEPQTASEDLLKRFAGLLLDPSLYDDATITVQKPGARESSARLCGPFRPAVAIRFIDAEQRNQDVLICFHCDEIIFLPIGNAKDTQATFVAVSPEKNSTLIRGLRSHLRYSGTVRVLELLVEAFPQQVFFHNVLKNAQKRLEQARARRDIGLKLEAMSPTKVQN